MSEAKPQTDACEQLLDYVYDELDEAGKRAFEQHLATCTRCPAELASFGKVRQVSARLMPIEEPPPALTGALHAQLMHAAAQRKPRRGALLSFPRKIMQHPAWAAAAMFVIVGSAITLNAVRGKLAMPVTARSTLAAAPAAPPPSVADSESSAGSVVSAAAEPMEKAKNKKIAAEPMDYKDADAVTHSATSTKKTAPAPAKGAIANDLRLDVPKVGMMKVATSAAPREEGAAAPRPAAKSRAKRDELDPLDDRLNEPAVTGSLGGGGAASSGVAKSSAPTTVARMSKEEERSLSNVQADSAPASPAQAAPMPGGVVAQAPMADQRRRGGVPAASVPAPAVASAPPLAQPQSSFGYDGALPTPKAAAPQQTEDLHRRADDLVRANRCDDAVKVYAELDRRAQRMSPKERANYVRCLTATGRQQQAEQQLDELKSDKSVTNRLVQQAEDEVAGGRRGVAQKPAKKSTPAVDRASQQQRAVEPPAPTVGSPAPANQRQ